MSNINMHNNFNKMNIINLFYHDRKTKCKVFLIFAHTGAKHPSSSTKTKEITKKWLKQMIFEVFNKTCLNACVWCLLSHQYSVQKN